VQESKFEEGRTNPAQLGLLLISPGQRGKDAGETEYRKDKEAALDGMQERAEVSRKNPGFADINGKEHQGDSHAEYLTDEAHCSEGRRGDT
jgi:hypothetical protein